MTSFQQIGLLVVALLAIVSARGLLRRDGSRRGAAFWLTVWLTGGVLLAWPEISTRIARALGIGRGADLIFYSTTLGILIGFFAAYLRFRHIDRQLTLVVRHLALQSPAYRPSPSGRAEVARDGHGEGG